MKKMVVAGLIGMLVTATGCIGLLKTQVYPRSGVVTGVVGDEITVTDFSGRTYTFTDANEDWLTGDICSMVMWKNFTQNTVYDDTVLQARYDGWVD